MADTNPLREKLAAALRDGWNERHATGPKDAAQPWEFDDEADDVLAFLAEFIGDGLLDANGQRWTKREEPDALIPASYEFDSEGDRLIIHKRADVPLFVLERSETDQEGQ